MNRRRSIRVLLGVSLVAGLITAPVSPALAEKGGRKKRPPPATSTDPMPTVMDARDAVSPTRVECDQHLACFMVRDEGSEPGGFLSGQSRSTGYYELLPGKLVTITTVHSNRVICETVTNEYGWATCSEEDWQLARVMVPVDRLMVGEYWWYHSFKITFSGDSEYLPSSDYGRMADLWLRPL